MSSPSPNWFYKQNIPNFRYKIQTEGKRGEKVGGKGASLNVGGQKHSPGHKVVSSNASYVIEPGADYSSTDAGIHSNGNDYLTFQGLPDYLAHLKDGVSDITGVVNQVGKSDKSIQKVSKDQDAKKKGEQGNKKVRKDQDAKKKGEVGNKNINYSYLVHMKHHQGSKTEHRNTKIDKVDVKKGRKKKVDNKVEKVRTDKVDAVRNEAKRTGGQDGKNNQPGYNHQDQDQDQDQHRHRPDYPPKIEGTIGHAIVTKEIVDLKREHAKKADQKVKKVRRHKPNVGGKQRKKTDRQEDKQYKHA